MNPLLGCASIIGALLLSAAPPDNLAADTDGRIGPAEWAGARTLIGQDGATLLALGDETALRLAVRSEGPGILTVWISHAGRVRLLHASAAIGEAAYERTDDGAWRRAADFTWDRSHDAASRRAHLAAHGWLASITPDWDRNEREFTLDLAALPRDARMAVSFGAGEHFDTLFVWPASVRDDTRLGDMQRGTLPERAHFQPDEWSTLAALLAGE